MAKAVPKRSATYSWVPRQTPRLNLGGLDLGEFDQMVVTGNLTLSGELLVDLIDGFQLTFNDRFLIAEIGGTLMGQFAGLGEGDTIGNFGGMDLFITYAGGNGNDVALFTAGLPGDFDLDGDVDGTDFLKWQRGESPISMSQSDLDDWQANFGTVASSITAASTAVPEPATGIILMLGLAALLTGRRIS